MHSFVDERIAPNAARYDREQIYPQDSFDACVEMELPSLGVPRRTAEPVRTWSPKRSWRGTRAGVRFDVGDLAHLQTRDATIMNFASEEIKHQYLPRIASGEIQASYCLSEADAGSDVASIALSRGA